MILFSYLVRPVLAQEIATSSSPSQSSSTSESNIPQLTVEEPTPDTPPSGSDRATYYIDKYYEKNLNGARKNYYYLGNIPLGYDDIQTGAVEYTLPDHLGSKSMVIDAHGAIKKVTDYYPYGQPANEQGTDPIGTNHQFTGKEFDPETLLQYFGARYYDNMIGKFTTVDPLTLELTGDKFKDKQKLWTFLSDPQRLNGYSYANNNPVVNYDPDGNSTVAAWILNPAITFTQVMTWKFGSDVYRIGGKQATVDLLQHSLAVNPSNIEIRENNHYSYIIDEIKGSPEYRQLVSDSIESAQKRGKSDFQTGTDVSLEFKSGDLFTSLHKVTPNISGKLVNGEWQLTSKITDVYDFNYNNYSNWPVDIANNSALISNYTGSISNYNIDIQFNENIKNKK